MNTNTKSVLLWEERERKGREGGWKGRGGERRKVETPSINSCICPCHKVAQTTSTYRLYLILVEAELAHVLENRLVKFDVFVERVHGVGHQSLELGVVARQSHPPVRHDFRHRDSPPGIDAQQPTNQVLAFCTCPAQQRMAITESPKFQYIYTQATVGRKIEVQNVIRNKIPRQNKISPTVSQLV